MKPLTDYDDWPVFRAFILCLADDEYFVGHHLGKWLAVSPTLEEDNALTSIAQDELGHARLWYDLVADGSDRSTDELAIEREPMNRRNTVLVEAPHDDFADTISRQFLYDTAENLLLESLANGHIDPVSDIATVALQEEPFHLEHARNWLKILTATEESQTRLSDQFERNIALSEDYFDFPHLDQLEASGVFGTPVDEIRSEWKHTLTDTITELGLDLPVELSAVLDSDRSDLNGRQGDHTAAFADVIRTMQPHPIDKI